LFFCFVFQESAKEIRRKIAISTREKEEEDSCTIYVENLPTSATIDSVTRLFEKFGKVLYVSLPRYKVTQVKYTP
jgi:La-related protein 7